MDLRLATSLAQLLKPRPWPEGVGLEVYLDPQYLEEDGLFLDLARRLPRPLSVHLPFWNLDLLSPDPEVRGLSLRRLLLGLDRAAELGADRAVFHSGIPHGRTPEEAQRRALPLIETLGLVLRRARVLGVWLFLENTHEPEPQALAPILKAHPELGFCFDPAHAHVFSQTPEPWPWLALGPGHLHLNDTQGVYDDHLNLGEGVLPHRDWLGGYLDRTVVLEVRGDPGPSLAYLARLDTPLTRGT